MLKSKFHASNSTNKIMISSFYLICIVIFIHKIVNLGRNQLADLNGLSKTWLEPKFQVFPNFIFYEVLGAFHS